MLLSTSILNIFHHTFLHILTDRLALDRLALVVRVLDLRLHQWTQTIPLASAVLQHYHLHLAFSILPVLLLVGFGALLHLHPLQLRLNPLVQPRLSLSPQTRRMEQRGRFGKTSAT